MIEPHKGHEGEIVSRNSRHMRWVGDKNCTQNKNEIKHQALTHIIGEK